MNTQNIHKKLILKYAMLIARGDDATKEEREEMSTIEDQLHLPKDSILREATKLGLSQIK